MAYTLNCEEPKITGLVDAISKNVLGPLHELITLGRTMRRGAAGVLAYFDRPINNAATVSINRCLEHLRDTAVGLCNIGNYITRALVDTSGLGPD